MTLLSHQLCNFIVILKGNMVMERKIDELGRVVVPNYIRRRLKLEAKTPVSFEIIGDGVYLTKARHTCIICNSSKDLIEVNGDYVCTSCKNRLNAKASENY